MTENGKNCERNRWAGRKVVGVALAITTVLVLAGQAALPLRAAQTAQTATATYTVLYSFTGGADGAYPWTGLIPDAAGNLYGTSYSGGDTSVCNPGFRGSGCGVVFKLDPAGNETVLHTFTGGADGSAPTAGLIRGAAGNLYGTTSRGGDLAGCGGFVFPGCGVVFKVDPAGNYTVLHTFTGGADGGNPEASLIRDVEDNFYSTTIAGGALGAGVVFKLDPAGNETVLYTFTGGADGDYPWAGLISDAAGNLYGTTVYGGAYGQGVVFELDPAGNETVLYTFTGGTDGRNPQASLIRDAAGTLYGTTPYGGVYGQGVVFELDPAGNETVLYSFTGGTDGGNPEASLIRDAAGNLYGTTFTGGRYLEGVVFGLGANGTERILHAFTGRSDGAKPLGSLLPYRGALYGTASSGGTDSAGVVFKLTLP